jgi:hypothetical protein
VASNGFVYAWGDNSSGQLATDGIGYSSSPIPVAGISNVVLVSAHPDGYHSLAATVDHGTNRYWGWGYNCNVQVGNGSGENQYSPALLHFCDACSSCVQLGTNGTFTAPCTGTLRLYFNDGFCAGYGFLNNSGSYTATVYGVYSPTTDLVVMATDDTGVTVGPVTKGSNYTFTATGYCQWSANSPLVDANGVPKTGGSPWDCSDVDRGITVCPSNQCYSLVGRIQ